MTTQREQFEARALPIFKGNPTWRESGDCELAWHFWQAAQAQQAAVEPVGYANRGTLDNIADGYAYLYPQKGVGVDTPVYTTPPSTQAAMRAALGVADKLRHALSNVLQSAPKDVWPKWLAVRDECDAEIRRLRSAVNQEPNFCESCAMDLSTCDCVESRPAYVQAAPDHTAAMRAALDALWVLTEHNALHFGDGHNTVVQGRASIAQLRAQLGDTK